VATSKVQICNLALTLLGADTIISLDDGTVPANLCKLHYELSRDAVLESAAWPFALKRRQLSQLSSAPTWQWGYAYQLPADPYCLLPIRTNLDDWNPPGKWVWEGRQILTDESSLYLQYIARVTDVSQFTSSFVQALARHIGWSIAYSITNSRGKEQEMAKEFAYVVDQADSIASIAGNGLLDRIDATTLTNARR
jgi:hypothetical protein